MGFSNGIVGFIKDGDKLGFEFKNDASVSRAGVKILEKFEQTSLEVLERIFESGIKNNENVTNEDIGFDEFIQLDWESEGVHQHLVKGLDFSIDSDQLKYIYIFNLDNDSLELYRMISKQREIKFHKVYVVTRGMFEVAINVFRYWEGTVLGSIAGDFFEERSNQVEPYIEEELEESVMKEMFELRQSQ